MIIIAIPALAFVLGMLMYALSKNPEVKRIGEIMLFCGFFWLVYFLAGKTVHLL